MKMKLEIVIDAGPETVWRLFDNPEDMKKWQPMIETVTERREPDFMAGTCESAMVKTIIVNHFEGLGVGRTRWSLYANHTFKGIYKLFGLFLGSSIRQRNEELMNNFKLHTETVEAERAK